MGLRGYELIRREVRRAISAQSGSVQNLSHI
jgi:hypothetical protein